MPQDNSFTAEEICSITKDLYTTAEYASNSHSLKLTYQVYGQIQMALSLHVITAENFFELSELLFGDGMNNPAANLN